MEVYTGDLVDVAITFSEKIKDKVVITSDNEYVIEDVCCDLQKEIRNILNDRMTDAFNELIYKEYDSISSREELKAKLFKIINEL